MRLTADILGAISTRKDAAEPFAVATVVRTVAATAAKAGAKAVILPDGTISAGWIGGGCARAAVLKAARDVQSPTAAPASFRCNRPTRWTIRA
jgi:xanthine dehydrogenase accessory factor